MGNPASHLKQLDGVSYSFWHGVYYCFFLCILYLFEEQDFHLWLLTSKLRLHKFLHVLFCLSRGLSSFHHQLSSQLRTDFFIKKLLKMEEMDLSFCDRSYFLAFSVTWYFFPWYTVWYLLMRETFAQTSPLRLSAL